MKQLRVVIFCINRNIMECKESCQRICHNIRSVLIETLWNVKLFVNV